MQHKWFRSGATAALLIVANAAYSQTWHSQDVAWRTYLSGTVCNISQPETRVITTAGQFKDFWRKLTGKSEIPRDVDFAREQLVAINLGSRPTGGYEVWVDTILSPTPGEIVVTYVERRPGSRDRVTNESSSPFVIVRMDRKLGRVTFKGGSYDGRSRGGGGGGGDDRNRDRGRDYDDPGVDPLGNGRLKAIEWRTYAAGVNSGITAPGTAIIESRTQFEQYWSRLAGGRAPQDVNFAQERLIAVNLGSRPTGGYSVSVTEVVKAYPADIVVTYVERRPSRRDKLEGVPSAPFVIIRIRRQDAGRVTFKPMTVDGGSQPGGNPEDPPDPRDSDRVEWRPYLSGTTSKITAPGNLVIRSSTEFAAYWRSLTGSTAVPRDVNFAQEYLVAINLGTRPTGGYSVAVGSVVKARLAEIVVSTIESQPRSNPNDKVTSSPFVIIRIKGPRARVSFKPMSVTGGR